MVALAINTGIAMSEWLDAGDRAIWTGLELIEEARRETTRDRGGRQMSG